jgi:ABC-type multidrug transport system fused ATPase/permease subunit
LDDLRAKLSIIPQDPVIFSGTIRYNLDPFSLYSDDAIWDALEAVQMKSVVEKLPEGLQTKIAEYGGNFSVGEGQLICVARAILKPSKILFVDEATANVDKRTDELIQNVLRTKFKDRTLITIAHRLNTIIDYDRIVVMNEGKVAEFGKPLELLSIPNGIFKSMASESGIHGI